MRDHDNKNTGHTGMRWMMILCLFLLSILFFGGGKLSSSGYLWPILIGAFVVAHVWMMFKGHGDHKENDTEDVSDAAIEKQPAAKNEHTHSGSCH